MEREEPTPKKIKIIDANEIVIPTPLRPVQGK
jgi:hypothetical protein